MKYVFYIGLSVFAMACSQQNSSDFGSYGAADFSTENAIEASTVPALLETQDTVFGVFTGHIAAVCQNKGCWMDLETGDKPLTVSFDPYGTFVPMNSADHVAFVKGKAFIEVTSVAMLQEYARDADKSEEEIAAITEPRRTYSLVAEGAIIE